MTPDPADDLLRRLADGETITRLARRDVVILAARPELTITWSRYAPGEPGPDLHVHREHTDAFYVLDGELTFALGPGAERIRAPAGGFVAVPPNVVHTFANESGAEVRWLNLHAPDCGFAAYLRAMRDGTDAAFDSFEPPAGGGLPAAGAVVSGPGEGERAISMPDVSLAELELEAPSEVELDEDEVASLYVLEGELDLTVEGSVHAAGPGTLAWIPRGARHTLAPRAPGSVRIVSAAAGRRTRGSRIGSVASRPASP